MGEIKENQRQFQKEIQTLATNVYNMACSIFAADGNINPVDGTYIRRIDSHPAQPPKLTGSILFSLEQSRSLVDTWLSSVNPIDPSPTAHINIHLAGFRFTRLSPSEMGRTQYMLSSSQLQSWLTSSLLEIHSESAPEVEELAGWVSEGGPVVMKMLVTDTLLSCRVRRLADLSLRVPDEVDGWRNEVGVRYLEERREKMVGRFVRERGVNE